DPPPGTLPDTPQREHAVGGTRAAGTDVQQEGPIVLGQLDAEQGLDRVQVRSRQRLVQLEAVIVRAEDLGAVGGAGQCQDAFADSRPIAHGGRPYSPPPAPGAAPRSRSSGALGTLE